MERKVCSKCKARKLISEFSVDRARKSGLRCYCRKCDSIRGEKYRKENAERIKEYKKQHRNKNTEHIRKRHNERGIKIRQTPRGKLNSRMGILLRDALRRNQNSPTLEKLVGYTPQDVRDHFESLFVDGMTWSNRGEWEIDHIRPICSFDYDSPNDAAFQKCWALSNLQPLWREDNMRKGKSIIEPL